MTKTSYVYFVSDMNYMYFYTGVTFLRMRLVWFGDVCMKSYNPRNVTGRANPDRP